MKIRNSDDCGVSTMLANRESKPNQMGEINVRNSIFITFVIIFIFSLSIQAQVETYNGMTFATREYKESREDNAGVEIDADYPELLGERVRADAFNQAVKAFVMQKALNATKGYELQKADIDLSDELKEFYALLMSHTIELANEGYVSIRFSFYQGAAMDEKDGTGVTDDGGHAITFTYDLKKRRQLKIKDLFKLGSKYQEFLSSRVVDQRLKEGFDPNDAKEEVVFESDISAYWSLKEEGIVINLEREFQMEVETVLERTIAYNRIPTAIRSALFEDLLAEINKGREVSDMCRSGDFDVLERENQFMVYKVTGKKNSRAYFYKDGGEANSRNCPIRRMKE